ncbi:MAG: M48 family metallopeptidase [Thermodesulfobacteriota bacterium]
MDFFERQDQARRKTWLLVLFFLLAAAGVVALVCLAAYLLVLMYLGYQPWRQEYWTGGDTARVLFWAGLVTALAILAGTAYKVHQLRSGGGEGVAAMLGGELVDPDTRDPAERRLVNVVEEMAIASGLAVPPVCVLRDEEGINAFAAGYTQADTVVGVTRGAVELLSRDELQGVVAHEFSHILNGDMRLNIRLIGVISGIMILSHTGYFLLRGAGRGRRVRGGNWQIALLGLMLLIIGSIGALFGNLIKAAVSRQREFLADAASVQFTRNPRGLAGALAKIGGLVKGSLLSSPNAPVASHMFFSNGVRHWFQALFATHPPLEERLLLIDPYWDGKYPLVEPPAPGLEAEAAILGLAARPAEAEPPPLKEPGPAPSAVATIGRLDEQHLAYARKLINSLPSGLAQAARKPYAAQAVIFGLLLDHNPEVRRRQLELLAAQADPALREQTEALLPDLEKLSPHARLPLLDLALPSLGKLFVTPQGFQEFKKIVVDLIKADRKVSLFEWMLHRALLRHLEQRLAPGRGISVKFSSLEQLAGQCSDVLSHLAHAGSLNPAEVEHAFKLGKSRLKVEGLQLKPPDRVPLRALDRSLADLRLAAPLLKRGLIEACAACITADRAVTVHEAELLRTVADTLDCPMPPLLPGQPLV